MDTIEILRRFEEIQTEQKRLQAQQEELLAMAEEVADIEERRERRKAIGSVNELVEHFGLQMQELYPKGVTELYVGPWGETWDGRGPMPDWMRRALRAGRPKQDFRYDPIKHLPLEPGKPLRRRKK